MIQRWLIAAFAAIVVSGAGAILALQSQPRDVNAVELRDDPVRKEEDNAQALEAVDDDEGDGNGDDPTTANDQFESGEADASIDALAGTVHGDGDSTFGDDGTSGGNVTVHGDGDSTFGDDGTSGGSNTVHGDGDSTFGDDGTSGGDNTRSGGGGGGGDSNTGGGDSNTGGDSGGDDTD